MSSDVHRTRGEAVEGASPVQPSPNDRHGNGQEEALVAIQAGNRPSLGTRWITSMVTQPRLYRELQEIGRAFAQMADPAIASNTLAIGSDIIVVTNIHRQVKAIQGAINDIQVARQYGDKGQMSEGAMHLLVNLVGLTASVLMLVMTVAYLSGEKSIREKYMDYFKKLLFASISGTLMLMLLALHHERTVYRTLDIYNEDGSLDNTKLLTAWNQLKDDGRDPLRNNTNAMPFQLQVKRLIGRDIFKERWDGIKGKIDRAVSDEDRVAIIEMIRATLRTKAKTEAVQIVGLAALLICLTTQGIVSRVALTSSLLLSLATRGYQIYYVEADRFWEEEI